MRMTNKKITFISIVVTIFAIISFLFLDKTIAYYFHNHIKDGIYHFIKLLSNIGDKLLPNSILYCLSLTKNKNISNELEKIVNKGVEVRWISAPKQYFPAIDPEIEFEQIPEQPQTKTFGGISPVIVNRQTDITKLLAST